MLSFAEENYLKTIYHLSKGGRKDVSTNSIAESLHTKPASVSDMIRKLSRKKVVNYKKYQGVNISKEGKEKALLVIRKHRLWEVFLVNKLKFSWDQVHEIAEQLEHIRSPLLIERLDRFLGFPQYDPHGDPIPVKKGVINSKPQIPLCDLKLNDSGVVIAVKDSSKEFLQYLDKLGASIGTKIRVLDKIAYDGSMEIDIGDQKSVFVSGEVSENILITS
ncbi:MAG: metal-dependent transcriptional regulator [Bacteroidetes bacterium]|nr:metal-dependent transcriptional regulator [Bacteroidota bacterium]